MYTYIYVSVGARNVTNSIMCSFGFCTMRSTRIGNESEVLRKTSLPSQMTNGDSCLLLATWIVSSNTVCHRSWLSSHGEIEMLFRHFNGNGLVRGSVYGILTFRLWAGNTAGPKTEKTGR